MARIESTRATEPDEVFAGLFIVGAFITRYRDMADVFEPEIEIH